MSVKNWTTTKIIEVLDESYNRGSTGKDYEDLVPELQNELWDRQAKNAEKQIENDIKQYNHRGI